MSAVNLKFIYANLLRAAELRVPVDAIFDEDLSKTIHAWESSLRMDSLSITIALLNVIATTLQFSSVSRSFDGRYQVPLNFYNIILARSSYGKSDISDLIRNVLDSICDAHDESCDLCLDEFTKAGLMNCLDQCTKIFMADEADMTFADAGLFNGFPKPSPEANCRSLVMILYDRTHRPYVRQLANKTVKVEKSKLNLLGLSTGELMATIVSRLKGGGLWDPMIGRFSWWALDGLPIMEPVVEPTVDESIPSIEQLAFGCSLINNCQFKYQKDALIRVVEWGNAMSKKSYDCRHNFLWSALLGKSIQHVHRYAAFIQTLEYGFSICSTYRNRFERFPPCGRLEKCFTERVEVIFREMFIDERVTSASTRQFLISDGVVCRAIDLVSGLLQQLKILMDDTNAPVWNGSHVRPVVVVPIRDEQSAEEEKDSNKKKKKKKKIVRTEYVSCKKLERVAVEILLYPSLCFIPKQLHTVSFLHNTKADDLNMVLAHLVNCDLLIAVGRGVKTSRRSTQVFIKSLPACDQNGEIDSDHKMLFDEKLKEFRLYNKDCTLDEYLKKNSIIALNAVGVVTNDLVDLFSMPEYKKIDLSPLYKLKEKGDINHSDIDHFSDDDHANSENNNSSAGLGNQQLTTVSAGNVFLENVDSVSNIFDDVVNTIETNSENVNSLLDRGNDLSIIDVGFNFNKELDHFLSDTRENAEHCTLVQGGRDNVEPNSISNDYEQDMRNEEVIINGANNFAMTTFGGVGVDGGDVGGGNVDGDGVNSDDVGGDNVDGDDVDGDGDGAQGDDVDGDDVIVDGEIIISSNDADTETTTGDSQANKIDGEVKAIGLKVKGKKRKKMEDENSPRVLKSNAKPVFSSPLAWRLRSSKHSKPAVDYKYAFTKKR